MIFVTILTVLIGLIYVYYRKKHQYFANLGIPYEPGYFPFGSWKTWKVFMGQGSLFQIPDEIFDNYPGQKVFGYFKPFGRPVLVIKDFELAKRVMVKDFDHFVDRGFLQLHPDTNPYMKYSMTVQNGEKWRQARSYITPIFTSGKLKTMSPLINETAKDLVSYLAKKNGQEIDGKDVFEKYTIELLSNLGLGVKGNVFEDDQSDFYNRVSYIFVYRFSYLLFYSASWFINLAVYL